MNNEVGNSNNIDITNTIDYTNGKEDSKKRNNKKILIILLAFLLVLFLVYIVFVLQHKFNLFGGNCEECNCDDKVIMPGFKTSAGLKSIKIEKVEKGVKDSDGKTYTKIKLSITDQFGEDARMDEYSLHLADRNKESITRCYSEATIGDNTKSDIFPSVIPANGTVEGYLYCETDRMDGEMLRITYVSRAYMSEDDIWQHDYKIADIIFTDDVKK